jgi:hypothetical protein
MIAARNDVTPQHKEGRALVGERPEFRKQTQQQGCPREKVRLFNSCWPMKF